MPAPYVLPRSAGIGVVAGRETVPVLVRSPCASALGMDRGSRTLRGSVPAGPEGNAPKNII